MFEDDDSLRELYQSLIIEHGRSPRHYGPLESATVIKKGYNPLCGDELLLQLHIKDDVIIKASFSGHGCAISMASASLLLEKLQGMRLDEAEKLYTSFHNMLLDEKLPVCEQQLGKLTVLQGVRAYPVRVKCATLVWQTLQAILQGDQKQVTTE